jgi:hypothetical protein
MNYIVILLGIAAGALAWRLVWHSIATRSAHSARLSAEWLHHHKNGR